jgi:hypothetical protein
MHNRYHNAQAKAEGHSQCEQRDLQHVTLPWVGITHGELCGERYGDVVLWFRNTSYPRSSVASPSLSPHALRNSTGLNLGLSRL